MQKNKTYFEIESGVVATKMEGGKLKFLTIFRASMNDYTLPKGHVEDGETLEETATREVFEETGYGVEINDLINSFEYKVKEKKEGEEVSIIRRVYFFSAKLSGGSVVANNPDLKEGVIIPNWLTYDEVLEKFTYETDKNLIRMVYSQNNTEDALFIQNVYEELIGKIRSNKIVFDNLIKFGLVGSANDGEFSRGWSDLDFLFVLKANDLGNIPKIVLLELRKINSATSSKYPDFEISFLSHTYDDFQKYVAFEYLSHYKFARFLIENDSTDFTKYIDKIIENRNLNQEIKKRYAIYHMRHFRFNLLRKIISTPNDKKAVKQIIDKLIETMILYLSYQGKTIQGKQSRFEEIQKMAVEENVKKIFLAALENRKNWKDYNPSNKELEEWLQHFEDVASVILKDNLYDVPEELINNN